MSWDEIARAHGTDKSSSGHGYMAHYERVLGDRTILEVLEIGVDAGASLRAWADIFPRACITGIDVRPECVRHAGGRIEVVVGDATNERTMRWLTGRTYDLIVDDGSHRIGDIEATLALFAPRLAPGGLYAIEDAVIDGLAWPAPLADVLKLLEPNGLRLRAVIHSAMDFVQGDVNYGRFALVLAEKP